MGHCGCSSSPDKSNSNSEGCASFNPNSFLANVFTTGIFDPRTVDPTRSQGLDLALTAGIFLIICIKELYFVKSKFDKMVDDDTVQQALDSTNDLVVVYLYSSGLGSICGSCG